MATPPKSAGDWKSVVIGRLPPEEEVLARNFALTAQYARWYKARPAIFKWAGMASFSSHRVGLALTPYQVVVDTRQALANVNDAPLVAAGSRLKQIVDIRNPEIPLSRKAEILPGLNILRETNNAVFEDIGWGHEAYLQGGIAAVNTAAGADPKLDGIREAFQLIHEGEQLGNTQEASEKIWEGNLKLLHREQFEIIQPMLDDVTVLFDTFLSAATVMSYWVNPLQIHPFKLTVFPLAMWIFNPELLAAQMSLPDFRQIDQRWEWIIKRVVPIFRRLDGTDPEVLSSIGEIIAAGSQLNHPT
jgi:hypothetical protein